MTAETEVVDVLNVRPGDIVRAGDRVRTVTAVNYLYRRMPNVRGKWTVRPCVILRSQGGIELAVIAVPGTVEVLSPRSTWPNLDGQATLPPC